MEEFFIDFHAFIDERLAQPLFDIEKHQECKEKEHNYRLYYNKLKNILEKEDVELLEKLVINKEGVEDFYIYTAYRIGFLDGIDIKNGIKKENKK